MLITEYNSTNPVYVLDKNLALWLAIFFWTKNVERGEDASITHAYGR